VAVSANGELTVVQIGKRLLYPCVTIVPFDAA
jgi:hypothetical protein